ncbi:GNAT family N-acetyltransferase [Roseibium aggregatum]|uniref:GNAT family N-acetyltransferase n=1 Tax=Roseibium aggregatum TaxID=187304 RepID=A0A939J5Y7_9HYPH|nr:GNAT family N-acetyltransferase [Roseibium aggregatum]MBN9673152.1 GNAT family N-acetyltransferase [Roseibium aggregatum]
MSDRLRFRLPSFSDSAFYLKLMNEPDYVRYIADHGIETESDALHYIKSKTLRRFTLNKVGLWLVELKDPIEPIGVCGLVVRNELDYPDLGFAFLEAYRGQGYGQEAARAVLEFVRDKLKLKRLCAITHPENEPSARLLRKIGFEKDGQRHLAEIGATSDYYLWQSGSRRF